MFLKEIISSGAGVSNEFWIGCREQACFFVILHIYKNTVLWCMEYCFHIWSGVNTVHVEILVKIQCRVCSTIDAGQVSHRRDVFFFLSALQIFHGNCSDEHFFRCTDYRNLNVVLDWQIGLKILPLN